ncbi:GNAT family N-acetyltransferase [Trinickia mobilis]|uniref:GNAT family N-acetyltransferase n=1 Tax=Trinickia mobilis TaxID=2816356 RepID=UPI001A8C8CBC|nr:GNAT family N-acetyltransferase [Trinickia mobilis]
MNSAIELEALPPVGNQPAYLAPLVRAIWPKRGDEINALFQDGGSDINASADHPFAIKFEGEYIGITGFYRYDDAAVGSCWHGITPSMRGRGLSRAAFDAVRLLAANKYPGAQEIIELIPSDRDTDLVPYFSKLGFRHLGEIARFDYLPKGPAWRIYRAPLRSPNAGESS